MFTLDFPWLEAAASRLPAVLPHAVLIRGQSGLGKEALAVALASGLLCEGGGRLGRGCGECAACHLFAAGTHPDFRKLEPQTDDAETGDASTGSGSRAKRGRSQIPVSAVRALADLVGTSAFRGQGKVIVISPAEAMHPSAANALLKMLEEPPPKTHFILVSHQPHMLSATILSRCFQLPVRPPATQETLQWLQPKAGQKAELALAMGSYAPLAAAELLENDGYWQTRADIVEGLGNSQADPQELAERAERLDPEVVGDLLGMWVYDVLATQAGIAPRYHRDCATQISHIARLASAERFCQWHDRVLEFMRAAYHPLNRRIALEALFARYPGITAT